MLSREWRRVMQRSTSTGSREPPSLDDLADMGDTDRVLERGRLLGDGDLFLLRPSSSSSSGGATISFGGSPHAPQ